MKALALVVLLTISTYAQATELNLERYILDNKSNFYTRVTWTPTDN